jgi:hypothetical protein
MRSFFFVVFASWFALARAADEPAPLLKPVAPNANSVRVRIATSEEDPGFYHFAARVPKPKGNKGEMADIKVAFEVRPGKSYVTAKKWQSWGYDIPANRTGILPELVIPAAQIAPKLSKGRDAEVRFPGLRLEIIEPPMGADSVLGCDLLVALNDLTKNADRAFEPRLYFADRFFELTVPSGSVKRPGTGDEPPAEPAVSADASLVPFAGPTTTRGLAVFTYSAVNGLTHYKTPDGKNQAVSVTISSTTLCPGGVIMSLGTARGCGVELEKGKDLTGTGTDFQTTIVKGTAKELRLGFMTGAGFKTANDFVLKDVTVWVDKNDSGHMIWLGPAFLQEQFTNPVYACGSDGAWKLYGRVKPELLAEIKTRPKKP